MLDLCVLFGLLFLRINWLWIKHCTSWFQVYKWKSTVIVFINTDKLSKNLSCSLVLVILLVTDFVLVGSFELQCV